MARRPARTLALPLTLTPSLTPPLPLTRWGNVVRLGAGCGRSFGQGLLTASGLTHAAALDLTGKIRSQAALAAVAEMVKVSTALTSLSLAKEVVVGQKAEDPAVPIGEEGGRRPHTHTTTHPPNHAWFRDTRHANPQLAAARHICIHIHIYISTDRRLSSPAERSARRSS